MRLWHEKLIKWLPDMQLKGQHRECAALRGNGWGRKHSTVNYVFKHSPMLLFLYHKKIMEEMGSRGMYCDPIWNDPYYRGKNASPWKEMDEAETGNIYIYNEHDDKYLRACIENLANKGIIINIEK